MATKAVTVHIPPDAEPDKLIPLLNLMQVNSVGFESVGELLAYTDEQGLGRRSELHLFAEICDLLKRDVSGTIQLTATGQAIATARPEIQADLVHFQVYTGWNDQLPRDKTESWAYRRVVDALWQRAPINMQEIAYLISEEVTNSALDVFEESVSFSSKSMRGMRKWLEALSPPAIENNHFTRRSFCHPELLLLSTGYVAQSSEAELGIDMLLTPQRREAICRLCVLDPAALDRALDWMVPAYPAVVVPGTSSGTYGRFLRFHKWPGFADLAR